jgi:UDP-galactopyranose mutase
VPRPENAVLYRKYQALAEADPSVKFVGRLATYRYYNMDQVTGQALATFRRINERLPANADTTTVQVVSTGAAALAS